MLGTSSASASASAPMPDVYSRACKALARLLGSEHADIAPVDGARAGRLFRFSLPGDQRANQGRMLVDSRGGIKIWHMLLLKPWMRSEIAAHFDAAEISGRFGEIPAYVTTIEKLESLPAGGLAKTRAGHESERKAVVLQQLSDNEVHSLALASLASHGWSAVRSHGGITYLRNIEGGSAAGRLVVNHGFAVVWSHRDDMHLGEPWREGKPTENGLRTMVARGLDLANRGIVVDPAPGVVLTKKAEITDAEKAAAIQRQWRQIVEYAHACPAGHRHLVKGISKPENALSGDGLLVFPESSKFGGAIAMPMLAPCPHEPGALEVVGIQALLPSPTTEGNDKQLIAGSRMSGAFTPWPLPLEADGKYSLAAWLEAADKTKPIVLCEGVATALAIHQAGAGHAVICYSSSNLSAVAKFFAENGFDQMHGIVVAADNDIGLKRDGSLRSNAVLKAIEAARACDGEVAFIGRSAEVGTDARDLFAKQGPSAVVRYIERAARADEVQARFEKTIAARRAALERDASLER